MVKKLHLYSISKVSYIHATNHLTQKQVKSLFNASEKSYKMGYPLNRFITIHYDDYADKKRPQKFVTDYLEHTRKWLQRRGLPVAYLYALENGKDKGIHVHLLIHIPPRKQMAYKRAMKNWLPFKLCAPHIVFRRIQYPVIGDLHPLNDMYGRLKYICKGIEPNTSLNAINAINQGEIMGRRWGISKTLR